MENRELLRVNHLKKYFQTPSGTLSAVDDGAVHSPTPRADCGRGYF